MLSIPWPQKKKRLKEEKTRLCFTRVFASAALSLSHSLSLSERKSLFSLYARQTGSECTGVRVFVWRRRAVLQSALQLGFVISNWRVFHLFLIFVVLLFSILQSPPGL